MAHAPVPFEGKLEDHPKFADFTVSSTPYKIVDGIEIPLWVFVPKDNHVGPRPIIIHLHGGYDMGGHALYPDWIAHWSLSYALAHSAIRISANYRLLPKSNGKDILSDLSSLLSWVEDELLTHLSSLGSGTVADLKKVIIYGESAGGYLAIQATLSHPSLIKACIAAYPMLDLTAPWYTSPSTSTLPKSPFGAPLMPLSTLSSHLSTLSTPPTPITDPSFNPFTVLASLPSSNTTEEKSVSEIKMPHILIYHGLSDSAVPVDHSIAFIAAYQHKFGRSSAIGKFMPGDHGCDTDATLETP